MKRIFIILILSFFFIYSGVCVAGSPKGLEKKGTVPKGFSQGEKSGWDGEYPKGWDKLSKEEKKEWLEKHGKDLDEVDDADEGGKDKAQKNKHKKQKKLKEKKGKKK